MTDRELLEQALSWIEAQPVPRMLGGQRIIEAIRTRLAEPEEAPRPAVRLSVGEISELSESILHCRKTGLSYIPYGTIELCRAIEAAVLKKNNLGE